MGTIGYPETSVTTTLGYITSQKMECLIDIAAEGSTVTLPPKFEHFSLHNVNSEQFP